jgi:hypothetical protein
MSTQMAHRRRAAARAAARATGRTAAKATGRTAAKPGIGRWSPYAVAARVAGGRAARDLAATLPDATAHELHAAGEAVRDGVEDMPDLLRTGFVVALLVSLVAPLRRLAGLREVERFGTGLGLATVFDTRGRDGR